MSTVQRNGKMRVLAFMAWLQYVIELLLAGFDGLHVFSYFSLMIIQWQVTVWVVVCSGCRKHNMLWSSCAVWRQCCVTSQRLCTKFVSTTLKFSWKFNFLLFGCYHWSCQDALCLANKTVPLITHTHTWLCGLHVDISLGQHPSSIVHCGWKGCPAFVYGVCSCSNGECMYSLSFIFLLLRVCLSIPSVCICTCKFNSMMPTPQFVCSWIENTNSVWFELSMVWTRTIYTCRYTCNWVRPTPQFVCSRVETRKSVWFDLIGRHQATIKVALHCII